MGVLQRLYTNGYLFSPVQGGVGFDSQAQFEHSFGITCMRERARMFGGVVNVHSQRGIGTTIEACVPV